MIDMVEKGNNVKPMPKVEAPQPYSLNGKTVMLTATEYSKLSENDKKKIKPYEAPKDTSGSWNTTINPVTGEIMQTNSKSGAIKIVGSTAVKPTDEEVKYKETVKASKQVNNYLDMMDKAVKKNKNAVGSFGTGIANFITNKANDFIKKPTPDRLTRASVQQFAADTGKLLARANDVGALSNQDVDQAMGMIPTVDDSQQEIAVKIQGLKKLLKDKVNTSRSQLTPAVQQKIERENPKPVTVIKVWSDAQYEYRKLSNGDIQKKAKK
jgi:hypothetical protein